MRRETNTCLTQVLLDLREGSCDRTQQECLGSEGFFPVGVWPRSWVAKRTAKEVSHASIAPQKCRFRVPWAISAGVLHESEHARRHTKFFSYKAIALTGLYRSFPPVGPYGVEGSAEGSNADGASSAGSLL